MSGYQDETCLTRIHGYSHSGEGVGRYQGKAVFIPGAIRGELARFRIVQAKTGYLRGELLETLEASTARSEAPCRLFPRCGGCQLQHQSYGEQLFFKQQLVASSLQHIGGLKDITAQETLGMAEPWHYRHTARFHVAMEEGGPVIGFFQRHSQSLQGIDACALLPKEFPPLLEEIAGFMRRRENAEGFPVQEVVLRKGWGTGELLIVFLSAKMPEHSMADGIAGLKSSTPSLVGILCKAPGKSGLPVREEVLWGRDYYFEKIAGITFRVPADTFFQNNPVQAAELTGVVRSLARPDAGESMIDLYCGAGLFALALAPLYKQAWGIESNRQAVEAASQNALLNHAGNARFIAGRIEQALPKVPRNTAHTLILDPPRQGCSPSALKAICDRAPARILYVSCNPSTLARDLAVLTGRGYRIDVAQPVDMFPQTCHVECVVLLSR